MTVLIITHSQDNESISTVMQAIHERGGKVFRFDTDRFPTDVQLDLSYRGDREQGVLVSEQGSLDLSNVSAVWYRRLRIGQQIPATMDLQLRHAAIEESRRMVMGAIVSLKGFHLDPLMNIRRADHKQLQLQVARRIGLQTPQTLTTNNPLAVREFARTCEQGLVTKMLSSFAVYEDGNEKVVFTNPVSPQDLEDLDGLRFCPMTFQEKVSKKLELRTTIVGREVFTAAIDSQGSEKSQHDWRRQGVALLRHWQPYELPQEVKEKLLQLMDYFGLNYGAIDLILTPDHRYVFLEVNPCGEFFWLDLYAKLPISSAIAKLLMHP